MHKPSEHTPTLTTDCERALLGSLLIDPSTIDAISELVTHADFVDSGLGKLFGALITLHQAGEPVADPVLMFPKLMAMGLPVDVCNASELVELARFVPTPAHAEYYARSIRRAALLRELHDVGLELASRATEAGATPESLSSWVDAQVQSLGARQSLPVVLIGELAAGVVETIRKPKIIRPACLTGLHSVDDYTGGLLPGELNILAARPGLGKTALALQIATNCANASRPVLFVSLEMSGAELSTRVLCGSALIDSRLIRTGTTEPSDVDRLALAAERIGDAPLFVWAPSSATLSRIRAVARQLAAAGELRLVVVDYLQLLRPEADEKRLQRYEQVTAMTAGLKILARELPVPVLCLAQLNRDADGHEPRLSNLRESGSIEQDADTVWFLHPKYPAQGNRPAQVDLIIAKHRHSDTGALTLAWYPHRTLFDDLNSRF